LVAKSFTDRLKQSIARRIYTFLIYWGVNVDTDMNIKIAEFRQLGVRIGDNVALWNVSVDPIYPELITIGNNVTITNTVILTHDDSPVLCVHKRRVAPVNIGSNVFIGWNSLLMPGVTIGDNTIIGAGSVVTKNIPAGSIAVGIPAKIIKTYEEYANRLDSDPTLVDYKFGSNLIEEHEHIAMKQLIRKKYRPDLT
jgi:maltose O-acetyltransferase